MPSNHGASSRNGLKHHGLIPVTGLYRLSVPLPLRCLTPLLHRLCLVFSYYVKSLSDHYQFYDFREPPHQVVAQHILTEVYMQAFLSISSIFNNRVPLIVAPITVPA